MVALVATLLLGLPGVATLLVPGGAGGGAPPGAVPSTAPLLYHASISSNETPPSGTVGVGSEVAIDYSVAVAGADPAARFQIYLPPMLMVLPTTAGGIHLHLASAVESTSGRNATVVPNGPAARQTAASTFASNGSASLSSLGLALMASWDAGAYTVEFGWRWAITAPDGATTFGPWSATETVAPAAMTALVGSPTHALSLGAPYALCFTGALSGRTFSVRLGTTDPVASYDLGETAVATGNNGSACLSATFTGPIVTPQAAVIHVWDTSNTTYLLYAIDVQVLDPPGSGGTDASPGAGSAGIEWGAGIGVVVLLVLIVLLFRRRGAPPAPIEVAPASMDPTTFPDPPPPVPELPPPPPPPGATAFRRGG